MDQKNADLTDTQPQQPPSQSENTSRLVNATVVVMLFFVLSRVTGLAREMIIGAQFGTSAELDAYLAAFRIPDLLFQVIAGGALGSAFIPTFSTYLVKSKETSTNISDDNPWLLFSRVLNLITLLLTLLAAIAAIFALPLVRSIIAPGFSPEQQLLTAQLMRWMLLSTVIFGASGLIMGALNALQHFLLPAAAPVLYNLAIVVGAWLLAPMIGIYGLVIGVIAGSTAHFLVQLPGLWRQGVQYTWRMNMGNALQDAGVREVARLMGPRVLGLFFVQMHFLVNTLLASGLSVGSLSALNYAWLLMLLPQGIFAQAVATVIFPTFAAQVAAGQQDEIRRTFGQTLRMVFFLTVPAAIILYILRIPLTAALLERGEFTTESTVMVAYALQFYAIGLVAHAALEIIVRAFYALHDTFTPVIIGVLAMILNILLSFLWIQPLGYGGLALANSTATILEVIVLVWLLRKRMDGLDIISLLYSLIRCGLAAAVMGTFVWLSLGIATSITLFSNAWMQLILGAIVAVIGYFGASFLLRSPELRSGIQLFLRRLA